MGRRLSSLRPAVLAALVLAVAPSVRAASFPPEFRFRSIATDRVTVHYHQGLEAMARQAATLAPQIIERHERRYGVRLPRVHIVLSDVEDDPNGFATPLPFPLVGVRAVAPTGVDDFGANDGWLRLVLTHELAHSVHLDEARGPFQWGRGVLGRAPFLFPNAITPTWMIEGLAVYEETEGTAFGRGRNPDVRMVLRMAALDGRFPGIDEAVGARDEYPGGITPYLFGEAFLRDLTERFGPATLPDLASVHAGRAIPYLDDLTARRVTGATFTTRWREWRARATAEFEEEAARIEAAGLSASTPLTARGVRQAGARFSPDGSWIAYTNRGLDRHRAIHLVRPDGSADRRLARRNDGYNLSWTPDGRAIVFDETDYHRRFALRSDLHVVDVASGRSRRLTRGLRARDPDVAPDGSKVVFVRQLGDRTELATVGMDGTGIADLTRSEMGVQWSRPRYSPRGDAIAASRMTPEGALDVVVMDADGGNLRPLTSDRARDAEPAWTPDGAHLVFRSDRDGVSNLYAVAVSDYRAAGYDVHLMTLDLGAAAPAAPFVDPYPPSSLQPAELVGPDQPYRAFPTLRPRFWSPYVEDGDELTIGAATGGADPLFRHVYGATLDRGFENRRFEQPRN
jgi:Tol biopolymer transport system component